MPPFIGGKTQVIANAAQMPMIPSEHNVRAPAGPFGTRFFRDREAGASACCNNRMNDTVASPGDVELPVAVAPP